MIDSNRTLGLIKGALFDPESTWQSYLPESDDWKKTAALLTGPLILPAYVQRDINDTVKHNCEL